MTSVQRAQMERFLNSKNSFDRIIIRSESDPQHFVRIIGELPYRAGGAGYFCRQVNHHPEDSAMVPDIHGDANAVETWLEDAYRLGHTVTYHWEQRARSARE